MDISATVIDLRSDTVTRPTVAMYERMMAAPLGDDGLDGDPTARALEDEAAAVLGKEAALFAPSCTMANLLATLAQVQRGEQVVLEAESHMFVVERGSATFTGAFHVPVPGVLGAMDMNRLKDALETPHSKMKTGLICMETSHTESAGAVLPLEHMQAVADLAAERGIPVHLDGARLHNASARLGVSLAELAGYSDTVSLCFSKGLSAPVGAVVAGSAETVARMRHMRRYLGGQQRQVGVIAAAALEGLMTMGARIADDHVRAARLSEALNGMHPLLSATEPQTNMVIVDVSRTSRSQDQWVADLERRGVLVRPWRDFGLRCVTHRHIGDLELKRVISAFRAAASAIPEAGMQAGKPRLASA